MKYYELDKEEEQIVKDFEAGHLVRVKDFAKHKKELLQAARVTLNKIKKHQYPLVRASFAETEGAGTTGRNSLPNLGRLYSPSRHQRTKLARHSRALRSSEGSAIEIGLHINRIIGSVINGCRPFGVIDVEIRGEGFGFRSKSAHNRQSAVAGFGFCPGPAGWNAIRQQCLYDADIAPRITVR